MGEMKKSGRMVRTIAMVGSTLLLCAILWSFLHNLETQFQKVEKDYIEGRTLNLSNSTDAEALAELFVNNGYVDNQKDAHYIADTLVARLKRMQFTNLYHLQKRNYGQVPMLVCESQGVLNDRVLASKNRIGLADSLPETNSLHTVVDLQQGDGEIAVEITTSEKEVSCGDVVVRLEEHFVDSNGYAQTVVASYAKSDAKGRAVFKGLDRKKGYSVLPIKRGYEYGSSKGIVMGHFSKYRYFGRYGEKKYVFSFEQQEHLIQMIDNETLKQIKKDGTLTVRTPKEYKAAVVRWFVLVMLAWWVLYFILRWRKKVVDPFMIAAAMFLTVFCVVMMFSIQDPLTEDLRGVEMGTGLLIGLAVIVLLQFLDCKKFYQNRYSFPFDPVLSFFRWLFLPFKRKVSGLSTTLQENNPWYKKTFALVMLLLCLPFGLLNLVQVGRLSGWVDKVCGKLPKGFGWCFLAILLTALLWTPLGREIGGMRVNLKLGSLVFQPSEIAKYLILIFMAAFFTQNADSIIEYSRPHRTRIWSKIKILGWVIAGLVVIVALYAALGDMGPALVLGVTFVLLYSLVKSKVNLEGASEHDRWKRIRTCDFAMLLYGAASFAAFLFIGNYMGNTLIFAILWFAVWILVGLAHHKQFFETAFILNLLVFMFVFGGQIMQKIPVLKNTDTVERFEARTNMCVNTWGDLDIENHGKYAKEVSNSQIANGLWSIATGGMTGQGLGKGNPNLTPAFYSDMILSSIGEQVGWFGLLIVISFFAILLRRMVVTGYKSGHPFAFYFCMGVALVTGVQFFIIALGSSGMIPLTGITVPFLSYGKVSMILNLAALGIVISFLRHSTDEQADEVEQEAQMRSVGAYNFPISIVSWTFAILALFTLGVWQYYGFWQRGETMVRPAFVINQQGIPVIEYNPRIALLTKDIWAGNIYDRNGVLLATSDKSMLQRPEVRDKLLECKINVDSLEHTHTQRYYPFGEDMFFMIGDQNTGLYFSYDDNNPIGYMAEAQHLSYLRDYDNILRDKDGNAVKVDLKGKSRSGGRFIRDKNVLRDTTIRYLVRDYSELIPYLKEGTFGNKLEEHNKEVQQGKFDLYLTVDAKLQKEMQDALREYVCSSDNPKIKDNNLLRISVVVLDAQNGELLTSSNYPIPNYQRLKEEAANGTSHYSDNYKDPSTWHAYTDRDLGLTYQTAPGSTAKVMSAMAGLNKLGVEKVRTEAQFPVYRYEVIDIGKNGSSKEPPMGYGLKEMVDMKRAIVLSSNCYFINLVNHFDCYNELEKIYSAVGISLSGKRTYSLHYQSSDVLKNVVTQTQEVAVPFYEKYIQKREAGKLDEIRVDIEKGKTFKRAEWMWAWGQGTMDASPLNMARVVSAVANGGKMPITHYLLRSADKNKSNINPEYVTLMSEKNANELKDYMWAQASAKNFPTYIGGKTGTPERVRKLFCDNGQPKEKSINDGWYVFYIETGEEEHPVLSVAVRMERIEGLTSGEAMGLAKGTVLNVLKKYYMRNN